MNKYAPKLTARQKAELAKLAELPDDQIDTSDIPEITDPEVWESAVQGLFYKPPKVQITLRLDADVLEWFRQDAVDGKSNYQTAINAALRKHVMEMVKQADLPMAPNVADSAFIAQAVDARDRLRHEPDWQPKRAVSSREGPAHVYPYENLPWVNHAPHAPARVAEEGVLYVTAQPRWDSVAAVVESMRVSGKPELIDEVAAYDERLWQRAKGGPCVCGCGETPSGRNRLFLRGHAPRYLSRLRDMWLRAHGMLRSGKLAPAEDGD